MAQEEPDRLGIRLDVMEDIIRDLDRNETLIDIFGAPVTKSLVIVADGNDLRIEEGGVKELTDEESEKFLEELNEIIEKNSS